MDKKIILLAIALVVLASGCFASSVTRSFSGSVRPGEDLTVTLTVDVGDGETFYAIDELVPEGWIVKNIGTGSAEHQGHIKWVTIEGAENTTNSYTLTAPGTAETAVFSGTYMFESMDQEAEIAGTKQANVRQAVQQPTATPAPQQMDYTLLIAVVAIVAVIVIAFIVLKKKK